MDWNTIIVSGIMYLFGLVLGFFIGKSKYQIGRMIMTTDHKQAIIVLMNLYNDHHINEEQYFLLLDFVISDTRNEIKINNIPWNVPKSPDYPPITVMYGCPTDDVIYDSANTCNKIEEEHK